jgi:hypothetical protein
MKRTAVINVVGLTEGLIGSHTPRIRLIRAARRACPYFAAFRRHTAQSTISG